MLGIQKSNHILARSITDTSRKANALATSRRLGGKRFRASTSSPEGSPVSPTALQGSEREAETQETSGESAFALSQEYDPNTPFSRTFRDSLQASMARPGRGSKWTWKRVATRGFLFCLVHQMSGQSTGDSERGLLLKTPSSFDATVKSGKANPVFGDSGSLAQEIMSGFVEQRIWPTPTSRDYRGHHGDQSEAFEKRKENPRGVNLVEELQRRGELGQLNPTWVEWLMGYPLGWTDSKDSATPSSPKSHK